MSQDIPRPPGRDRVTAILNLAKGLLDDNADHVAACCGIPEA